MRKSEQYSVAIFLAVALFAGTFAGSSAPAFVVDAQATEEKNYYKEKERHSDKNSRHDGDRDGRDGHDGDRDGRDGHDGDRDGRDGHDGDKSSVKYIKCNNVNINGKERNSHGGNQWPNGGGNEWPRGDGNEWPRGDGNEWPRGDGNEWPRGSDSHGFPGFVKQTDKDVVVICIFNNDGQKQKENKTAPIIDCEDCFIPTNEGGFLPPPQLAEFEDFLADLPPQFGITNIVELCEAIEDGLVTEQQLERLVLNVFESGMSGNLPAFAERLLDCLISFLPPEE